jgi:hypothetical protein
VVTANAVKNTDKHNDEIIQAVAKEKVPDMNKVRVD